MMNMKKTLALLLAVVMVIGMIPFGAMAEEAATHIDTCQEGCALEDCACPCHAAPETPAEEPKQEQPPVTPAALDGEPQETPVVEPKQEQPPVTPAALNDEPQETPVVEQPKVEEPKVEVPKVEEPKVEEPKVEEPKVEETPTCTPVEGVHAEGCALQVKPEVPVVDETKTEEMNTVVDYLALYDDLMASTDFGYVYQTFMAMTDADLTALAEAITDEQHIALNNHILDLAVNAEKTMSEVDSVSIPQKVESSEIEVSASPEVAYNYTHAAPFKAPVEGPAVSLFSRMRFMAAAVDNTVQNENVITSKTVSKKDGSYMLTLDAFVTGQRVTSTETKQVPTDIILVLDQSGSMSNDFTSTRDAYDAYDSKTTNKTLYESGNVYYKDGDKYVPVTVERTVSASTTQAYYSKPQIMGYDAPINLAWYLWYNNGATIVYRTEPIEGGTIEDDTIVTISRSDGFPPTYTYTDANGEVLFDGYGLLPDIAPNLYVRTVDTTSEHLYTYTYMTSDGVTHTVTSSGNDGTERYDTSNNLVTFYYGQSTTQTTTRLSALKEAVNTFADNVYAKAKGADGQIGTADDVNHRIAVVGFASGNSWSGSSYYYGNTEVFEGSNQYTYNAGREMDASHANSAQSHYDTAFQNMNTENGYNNIIASKNALDDDGGTIINLGMEMANGILEANPVASGEKRNRVVIVFTDGVPGWSGYDSGIASSAISEANETKNTHGATVYTVGIFNGADATSAGSSSNNASETQRANWFMQNLSSNNGTVQTPSYYMSASNSNDLNGIFQSISNNIVSGGASNETLGTNTVVKDIVSPYFTLPENAEKTGIKVYTMDCNGVTSNGIRTFDTTTKNDITTSVTVNVNEKTIDVSGFDFSANWCGNETVNNISTARGKKLIIEIPIIPEPQFLGGNDVPTNGKDSGIYQNGTTLVENFDIPTANVPIPEITVTAVDKNVYLADNVTGEQMWIGATATAAGNNLLGPLDWQDDYVTITRSESEDISQIINDGTYTLTVTIEPKPADEAEEAEGEPAVTQYDTDDAKINVFKPVITWQDSQINAGETPVYKADEDVDTDNFVSLVWKHGDTLSTDVTMHGKVPTLDYAYSPVAAPMNEDTPVDVTVFVGTGEDKPDITNHVTFVHVNCGFDGCKWQEAKKAGKEFIVHIKSFDLTIYKTGVAAEDAGAPFVVNVKCDATKIDMDVVLYGEDHVTIKGLPSGTYIITETSGYWRYDLTQAVYKNADGSVNNTREVKPSGATASITIENKRTNDKWLDDWAKATNNFGGSAIKDSGIADN